MVNLVIDTFSAWLFNHNNWDTRFCDKNDRKATEGTYLLWEKDADLTIHDGDIVIDAGAWWGDFSIYAAKQNAYVYAFEPDDENIEKLSWSIKESGCADRVEVISCGIGADSRTMEIVQDSSMGMHFSENEVSGGEESQNCLN